jgi:hypothetical protein
MKLRYLLKTLAAGALLAGGLAGAWTPRSGASMPS